MSHSALQQAARRRSTYTGEPHQAALRALRELEPCAAPIPAPCQEQALLETLFLKRLGQASAHIPDWRGACPLGLEWVRPAVDDLTVRIAPRLLAVILGHVLPTYVDSDGDVDGIPGLRVRRDARSVILHRLGSRAVIRLADLSRQDWEYAVDGAHVLWWGDDVRKPWVNAPDTWDRREARFAESYHGYGLEPEESDEDGAPLAAGFLRRIAIFRQTRRLDGLGLYMNRQEGRLKIHVDWENGPYHPQIVGLLCDSQFGIPGLTYDAADLCMCDCCAPSLTNVRLTLGCGRGSMIYLRRQDLSDGQRELSADLRANYRARVNQLLRRASSKEQDKAPAAARSQQSSGARSRSSAHSTSPRK